MNFENGIKSEQEKKKTEKENEELKKKDLENILYFKNQKEKITKSIETDKQLFELKQIIQNQNFDKDSIKIAEKVLKNEYITNDEIETIFEKIDEIENNEEIDKFIPENLKITKEEYLEAVYNKNSRIQIIFKIKQSLSILANNIKPNLNLSLSLFSGFLFMLDKNLLSIQENYIDIKKSLENIDKENEKLSLWQRFIRFLKEVFG